MWDLIVSVPDHCLSFYFESAESLAPETILIIITIELPYINI